MLEEQIIMSVYDHWSAHPSGIKTQSLKHIHCFIFFAFAKGGDRRKIVNHSKGITEKVL